MIYVPCYPCSAWVGRGVVISLPTLLLTLACLCFLIPDSPCYSVFLFEAREMINHKIKKEEYIGIDIFSGAGGLSLGAEMAGIDVQYGIEIDKYAASSFTYNHKNARVLTGDITKINTSDLNLKGNVFVIMGGPPCQGFSMSNTMSRNMNNEKNFLYLEFVRFVRELKPKWFVLENVWGLTKMNDGQTLEMIKESFYALGYTVKANILWANDYGVPQKRYRCFIVGNNEDINFDFPVPQNTNVTVHDAISDLPPLTNGQMLDSAPYSIPYKDSSEYAKLMRGKSKLSRQNYVSLNNDLVIQRYAYIPQGGNWRDIPDELMKNYADKSRCHSGIYKRLRDDAPSVVISNYRKSMLIHPTQDRGLSVREAARLQSFPDNFIFQGPHMSIQQQIGNAVPPLLSKAVFNQILSYYE